MRAMETPAAASRLKTSLYWVGFALAVSLLIVALGAALGAAVWCLLGPALGSEADVSGRLAYGASLGWRYARVWAGGLAFVLCFIKAHERFSVRAWLRARFR